MDIQTNLRNVLAELPEGVRLVAVSKFHPAEAIEEAYRAGQRIFGESKEQELSEKYKVLPKDIEWHFIGHLQTNKVKYIAPYITLIEAVDSYKLLAEINKQAGKHGRIIPCLLEIHVAQEESKYGFMATNTDDETQIEQEFRTLKALFDEWKQTFFAEEPTFKEISMGMSHDYRIAIRAGSTLVRVGSKIFGERNYVK